VKGVEGRKEERRRGKKSKKPPASIPAYALSIRTVHVCQSVMAARQAILQTFYVHVLSHVYAVYRGRE